MMCIFYYTIYLKKTQWEKSEKCQGKGVSTGIITISFELWDSFAEQILPGDSFTGKRISFPFIFRCVPAYTFTKTNSEVICMKSEIKLQNARSAPQDAAVFIANSFVLRSSFSAAIMIAISIKVRGK